MSHLDLYVCGVHENGKPHYAYHALQTGKAFFSIHNSPPVEWRQGRGIGPLLYATLEGLRHALGYKATHVTIYHAFEGVRSWVTREWQARKVYTQKYREQMNELVNRLTVQFVSIKADNSVYRQLQHACFVATGREKPKSDHDYITMDIDPFPGGPPKDALDSTHYCPRCFNAGEFSRSVKLQYANGYELVCPLCHLHLKDHEKLSYDRWRDCTNPKCAAPISLMPRVLLGDAHPMLVLHCPFCFTTFPDQLLTKYWAKLWVDLAEKNSVTLEGAILESLRWQIRQALEEKD